MAEIGSEDCPTGLAPFAACIGGVEGVVGINAMGKAEWWATADGCTDTEPEDWSFGACIPGCRTGR